MKRDLCGKSTYEVANSESYYPREKVKFNGERYVYENVWNGTLMGAITLIPSDDYKNYAEKTLAKNSVYRKTLECLDKCGRKRDAQVGEGVLYVSEFYVFEETEADVDLQIRDLLQLAMRESYKAGYRSIIIEVVGPERCRSIQRKIETLNSHKIIGRLEEYGEEHFSVALLTTHQLEEPLMFSALQISYGSNKIFEKLYKPKILKRQKRTRHMRTKNKRTRRFCIFETN